MAPPRNNGASSKGSVGNRSLFSCVSLSRKRICRFCRREFNCGRALGGHIRVHYKEQRMTRFKRKKRNTRSIRRRIQSCAAPSTRRTMHMHRTNTREDKEGDAVVIDLSKSLSGFGWKVHRKRVGFFAKDKKKNHAVMPSFYGDDDDDDDDESCFDDGDEEDFNYRRLKEMLKKNGSPHRICRTRRLFRCKVCDVVFATFQGVFCHVDEHSSTNDNGDDEDDDQGMVMENEGKGKEVVMSAEGACSMEVDLVVAQEIIEIDDDDDDEVAEVGAKSGHGGGSMEIDLNKMPPPDDN